MPAESDWDAVTHPGNQLTAVESIGKKRPPRHRLGKGFLRGPIPWDWLETAIKLRGQSLQVAIVLWRECGISKARTLKFRPSQFVALGMHEDTAKRALKALESAGLVSTEYHPGQCLEVTLLDLSAD